MIPLALSENILKVRDMLPRIFLAFILISLAEIYLLVRVGEYIGALNTVAIVVLTGIAGAALARMQGLHALYKIRTSLQQGNVPSRELMDALLILAAGVLLLAPGFISDAAGIVLLLPMGRALVRRLLLKRIRTWAGSRSVHIEISPPDHF